MKRMRDGRGQISLEALLLWAGLAAMLALTTPALASMLEAQQLLFSAREFESFSENVERALHQAAFSAPGTRLTVSVPQFEGLSAEILEQILYIDFDNAHFSARKTREIHSPLPLEGNPSLPATAWIISRLSNEIFIESSGDVLPSTEFES